MLSNIFYGWVQTNLILFLTAIISLVPAIRPTLVAGSKILQSGAVALGVAETALVAIVSPQVLFEGSNMGK